MKARTESPSDRRWVNVASIFSLLVITAYSSISTSCFAAKDSKPSSSGSLTTGVTDSEIVIGSCLSLSGSIERRGHSIKNGADAYFRFINDQGGVNGRKVKLNSADDFYDSEKAEQAFNSSIRGKAFAGALFQGSAPITKYVRLGQLAKVPMMGFCAGTPVAYVFHPMQFVLRPSYLDESERQIEGLWSHGVKRIAVLYQDDLFGAACIDALRNSLQKHHAKLVADASFARKSTDLMPAIETVMKAEPEAIILAATEPAVDKILDYKSSHKLKTPFLAFSVASDYMQSLGKASEGMILSQVVPPVNGSTPAATQFRTLYKKYFHDADPTPSAFEGYLNAVVIVEGLKRAGHDLTQEKFVKALESLHDFDLGAGPNYKVTYSDKKHAALDEQAVSLMTIHNGQFTTTTNADWKKN